MKKIIFMLCLITLASCATQKHNKHNCDAYGCYDEDPGCPDHENKNTSK